MPKNHLKLYLDDLIKANKIEMAESIRITADSFLEKNLKTFSYSDHITGLLFGNVQAGKTSQVFGIVCSAADASFSIFMMLTTDNTALYNQTLDRVRKDLTGCGFCICGELEKQKFIDNALAVPAIIVLKKNSRVLLQWYNTLASSSFVKGNALFIIDDEADAASPNTLVNKQKRSTINTRLSNIRDYSIASIYLQVTGTPQALLLQSSLSDFKPAFTFYFQPGKTYLGGQFFFNPDDQSMIRYIESYNDPEKPALYDAVVRHLLVSALLFLDGGDVCNFVIHPGVSKASHQSAKGKVEDILKDIYSQICEPDMIKNLEYSFNTLPDKYKQKSFMDVYEMIRKLIADKQIKILLMNGDTSVLESDYTSGANIVIGGNVLGRGVTFPKLQTLYYTRTAKKPQADTMWQHSRMFGYDRIPELMSVYLTRELYRLFERINTANESIIAQIEAGSTEIKIMYPEGLNPTRKNVIDVKMVDLITGGSNYYPDNPENDDIGALDKLLSPFESSGYYQVSAKMIIEILNHIIPSIEFSNEAFINVIRAILDNNPSEQSVLIIRRDRAVTQGTGSLLSPNDRELGDQFKDKIVLTMYKIAGDHGWKQPSLWVPNIKLPHNMNYYDAR